MKKFLGNIFEVIRKLWIKRYQKTYMKDRLALTEVPMCISVLLWMQAHFFLFKTQFDEELHFFILCSPCWNVTASEISFPMVELYDKVLFFSDADDPTTKLTLQKCHCFTKNYFCLKSVRKCKLNEGKSVIIVVIFIDDWSAGYFLD